MHVSVHFGIKPARLTKPKSVRQYWSNRGFLAHFVPEIVVGLVVVVVKSLQHHDLNSPNFGRAVFRPTRPLPPAIALEAARTPFTLPLWIRPWAAGAR